MKDAYFKINSSLVKLEQDKLIVTTTEELKDFKYNADKVIEKGNKLQLVGNAILNFPNKSTFKANEIIVEEKVTY